MFGAVSTSLGAIVRYVGVLLDPKSETAYYASLVGQCMCALGQPMFVNSPGLLSANWFGVHERNIATTVASLFAVIGNAVGQVMPAIVVSEDEDTGETKGMEDLLLMQAIMATVCAVGCAGWFQVSSLRTPLINNSPSPRLSMNPPSLPLKLPPPPPPPQSEPLTPPSGSTEKRDKMRRNGILVGEDDADSIRAQLLIDTASEGRLSTGRGSIGRERKVRKE